MNIGIIGYGKMGKIIERIALERNHIISSIIDIGKETINLDTDVYIDFSNASALEKYLPLLCEKKIPLVIGTTGWNNKFKKYENLFLSNQNRGIWSSNYSLGVNLFWKVVENASLEFNNFSDHYDVAINEFHHNKKVDSPSGTAISTANLVLKNFKTKKILQPEKLDREPLKDELHITSTRLGSIPGIHSTYFDSLFDTIEIKHTARTREGFALGAVLAAEYIKKIPVGLIDFYSIFNKMY